LGVNVSLVENDAVAAALGESVLRAGNASLPDLIYISLGTGVGSAYVADGVAGDLDLGHRYVGGDIYCTGCRNVGCLNAHLCSQRLPAALTAADQAYIARTLAFALEDMSVDERTLLVLGGGIARRYPAIASILDSLAPNPTELTLVPVEAKSAAYAGLDYLSHRIG